MDPRCYICSRCGYSFPLNVRLVSGGKDPPRRVRHMSFWEGWWLAYWPLAMVVPMVSGAEGAAALDYVIWLQVPWMLLGWPVKRVSAWWTAKMRRKKALMALDRVLDEGEQAIAREPADQKAVGVARDGSTEAVPGGARSGSSEASAGLADDR